MALCAASQAVGQPTSADLSFYRADLNGDQVVDSTDEQLLMDNMGKFPSSCRMAYFSEGDVNHDGLVDANDLLILKDEKNNDPFPSGLPAIPAMPSVKLTTSGESVATNNNYQMNPVADLLLVRDCYGIPGACGSPATSNSTDLVDPTVTSRYTFDDLPQNDPDGWDNLDTLWFEPDDGYTHVHPEIDIGQQTTDGFELEVTWKHPVAAAECGQGEPGTCAGDGDTRAYGILQIPFLMFGPEVYVRQFQRSSAEVAVDFGMNRSAAIQSHKIGQYPNNMYAPAMTIRGLVPANGILEASPTDWPQYTSGPDHLIAIGQSTHHAVALADGWINSWLPYWQADQPSLVLEPEQSDLPLLLSDTEPSLAVGEVTTPLREYVVGISAIYPAVEYRFGAELELHRRAIEVPGDSGNRVYFWTVTIDPNSAEPGRGCNGQLEAGMPDERPCPGMLRPGQTRSMRLVVRFYRPEKAFSDHNASNPVHRGHYLNLFREYRRYFKQHYGDVQYARDPRPFKRVDGGTANTAGGGACNSPYSHYGFVGNNRLVNTTGANGTGFNGNNFAQLENPAEVGWTWFTGPNGAWEKYRSRGFQRQVVHGASGNWCRNNCYVHESNGGVCELTPLSDCVVGDPMAQPPTLGQIHNWPFSIWGRWTLVAQQMCALSDGTVCGPSSWHDHPIISTLDAWGRWISASDATEQMKLGSKGNATRELGIWWGRSTLPTVDIAYLGADQRLLDVCAGEGPGFCDADSPGFNLGFAAAIDELTNMVGRTSVNMIGLDFSNSLREWRRYHWVQRLRYELDSYLASIQRGPWQGKLVTEAYSADFTHTLEPTWFQIWKSNPIKTRPPGPHAMIDFLNQGAESWGAISRLDSVAGVPQLGNDVCKVLDEAAVLARRGFSPGFTNHWDRNPNSTTHNSCYGVTPADELKVLDPVTMNIDESYIADDAWRMTVPDSLWQPPH